MQPDGHGSYIIVLLKAGIFPARRIFLLQPANMIMNSLQTACLIQVNQAAPVVAGKGIFPGQKESVREQQDIAYPRQFMVAVPKKACRLRLPVQNPVADIHLQPHPEYLIGENIVDGSGLRRRQFLPQVQGFPIDIDFRGEYTEGAVVLNDQNQSVAGLAVFETIGSQADDRKAGRPQPVPLGHGDILGKQSVADAAVGPDRQVLQTGLFFLEGLSGDLSSEQSTGQAACEFSLVKTCCTVEDTEQVIGLKKHILIERTAAFFQDRFHDMVRKGRVRTGESKVFG